LGYPLIDNVINTKEFQFEKSLGYGVDYKGDFGYFSGVSEGIALFCCRVVLSQIVLSGMDGGFSPAFVCIVVLLAHMLVMFSS
jgi:hypothetical protein